MGYNNGYGKRFFITTFSKPTSLHIQKCVLKQCYTHSPMGWLFLREIMTTVYFVRHCKPDGKVIDERNRPLTDEWSF